MKTSGENRINLVRDRLFWQAWNNIIMFAAFIFISCADDLKTIEWTSSEISSSSGASSSSSLNYAQSSSSSSPGSGSSSSSYEQSSSSSIDNPLLNKCEWQGDIIYSTEKMVLVNGGKTITPISTGDCENVELPSVIVPTWQADAMLITDKKAKIKCGEDDIEIDCPSIKIKNPGADTFYVDRRDQQIYQTIKISSRELMAENLNYESKESLCYGNDPANCNKYGRLYLNDICDDEWQSPYKVFWNTIIPNNILLPLEAASVMALTGWAVNICEAALFESEKAACNNSRNAKRFTALPGGLYNRQTQTFEGIGSQGYWLFNGTSDMIKLSSFVTGDKYSEYMNRSSYYTSIRCIRAID